MYRFLEILLPLVITYEIINGINSENAIALMAIVPYINHVVSKPDIMLELYKTYICINLSIKKDIELIQSLIFFAILFAAYKRLINSYYMTILLKIIYVSFIIIRFVELKPFIDVYKVLFFVIII